MPKFEYRLRFLTHDKGRELAVGVFKRLSFVQQITVACSHFCAMLASFTFYIVSLNSRLGTDSRVDETLDQGSSQGDQEMATGLTLAEMVLGEMAAGRLGRSGDSRWAPAWACAPARCASWVWARGPTGRAAGRWPLAAGRARLGRWPLAAGRLGRWPLPAGRLGGRSGAHRGVG